MHALCAYRILARKAQPNRPNQKTNALQNYINKAMYQGASLSGETQKQS